MTAQGAVAGRRSPALARLPRSENGLHRAVRVKLRTTWHGGVKRAHPERYCQLTVPAEIADALPPVAVFDDDHRTLTYHMVSPR